MSNRINSILSKITDSTIREQLEREIHALQNQRKFGLVFEHHLPEHVALPGVKVRRGLKVTVKDAKKPELLTVARIKAEVATCVPSHPADDETPAPMEYPLDQLVVTAEFGDPIYPGLKLLGTTEGPGTAEDAPSHLVINAENHHALQTLQWSHGELVDLCYIDPPYNTGNKSWQYNDHYVASQDAFKHSKWLSFMERRLTLAHKLLKPTGAIMISIGDDEQHRLRMLMDQIFGERNKVAQLAVEMSTTSGPKTTNAQDGTIVKNIEYVLIYRKSEEFDKQIKHTPLYDSVKGWDKHYSLWLNDDGSISNFYDELASDPESLKDIKAAGLVRANGEFVGANGMDKLLAFSEATNDFIARNLAHIATCDKPPVSVMHTDPPVRGWIEVDADHRTYLVTRLTNGKIKQVYTLARNYRVADENAAKLGRTVIRGDLWRGFHQDMGTVSREGGVAFTNGKKPIRLISQLIKWANHSPDAVILDFFGGSGTTAHAVASLNAVDGGRRQSIVVTNNELPADVSAQLSKAGFSRGDDEFEKHGVFHAVTKPRLENVFSSLPGRVAFFDLEYLDANKVADDMAFAAINPLLWMRAGAVGAPPAAPGNDPVYVHGNYAVLRSMDSSRKFAEALNQVDDSGQPTEHLFAVTNSPSEFSRWSETLPVHLSRTRLYEHYLKTFEINTLETSS